MALLLSLLFLLDGLECLFGALVPSRLDLLLFGVGVLHRLLVAIVLGLLLLIEIGGLHPAEVLLVAVRLDERC